MVAFTGDAVFEAERPVGVFDVAGLIRHIALFTTEVLTENRLQFCVCRKPHQLVPPERLRHVVNLRRRVVMPAPQRVNPLPDLLHGHRVPGCRPFPFFLYRKGGGIYIYRKCLGFFAGGRHPAMVKAKAWSNLSRVPTPGLPPDLGQKSLFFGSFWVEPGTPSAPAVG